MNQNEILNKIKNFRKGTYVKLTKSKDFGSGLTRETKMVIRLGVDFKKLRSNVGRTVGKLPWGHWVSGLENYVIEHKGNYYLRVTSTNVHESKSIYKLNGTEITKAEAAAIVGPKKLESKESEVYNIKFDNIISIG